MAQWTRQYDYSESWESYIASRVRVLVQGRRWIWLRNEVWARDGGICQCCGASDGETMATWELGHIVDRLCGGKDELSSLLVMCLVCNRKKPFHETVEAFEKWRSTGGWFGRIARAVGLPSGVNPPPIDYSRLG